MKIAIVEDDGKSANLLKDFIARYQKKNNHNFVIAEFNNGLDFISDYTADYDLVFMDIKMPFMNGMETAKTLRTLDKTVTLIFVTNLPQFAVKGYEVEAFDFLIKPVTYFDFALKMDRALAKIDRREKEYICVKNAIGLAKVAMSEILFAEVNGRYVKLHTTTGEMEMHESMKNLEKNLMPYKFFRCDNSFLVNLAYVTGVDKNSASLSGKQIPVSRAKHKKFMDALTIYLGKKING